MDSALLTPVEVIPADAEVAPLLAQLLAEVASLRAEMATLRRENLELRQQAGYWRSRHSDAVGRIAVLEQQNEHLRREIRKLQAERLRHRPEKAPRGDRTDELEQPTNAKPRRSHARQPGQAATRRRRDRHL